MKGQKPSYNSSPMQNPYQPFRLQIRPSPRSRMRARRTSEAIFRRRQPPAFLVKYKRWKNLIRFWNASNNHLKRRTVKPWLRMSTRRTKNTRSSLKLKKFSLKKRRSQPSELWLLSPATSIICLRARHILQLNLNPYWPLASRIRNFIPVKFNKNFWKARPSKSIVKTICTAKRSKRTFKPKSRSFCHSVIRISPIHCLNSQTNS